MKKICFILPSNKTCAPNNIALCIAESVSHKAIVTVLYLKEFSSECISSQQCTLRKMTLKDFISFHQYDVIHSHMLKPDLINAVFSVFYRNAKTKTISTIHSNIHLDLSTYIKSTLLTTLLAKIWFICLNLLDTRVVVSQSLGCNQQKYLNDYQVIHNGIAPITIERKRPPITKEGVQHLTIGVLSRLHPGKGIEDAFYLAENEKDIDIFIYGTGTLAHQCHIEAVKFDNLHIKGHAHNIQEVFHRIDMLLIPSRHEGFGMTLLESLTHYTPVICYDLPVFREILGVGDYYYKNTTELLFLLSRFIEKRDENLRVQRDRLSLFTDVTMVKKYDGLYG